jgi:hypothetical protein
MRAPTRVGRNSRADRASAGNRSLWICRRNERRYPFFE